MGSFGFCVHGAQWEWPLMTLRGGRALDFVRHGLQRPLATFLNRGGGRDKLRHLMKRSWAGSVSTLHRDTGLRSVLAAPEVEIHWFSRIARMGRRPQVYTHLGYALHGRKGFAAINLY